MTLTPPVAFRIVVTYRGVCVSCSEWLKLSEYLHYTVTIKPEDIERIDKFLGGPPREAMPINSRAEFSHY